MSQTSLAPQQPSNPTFPWHMKAHPPVRLSWLVNKYMIMGLMIPIKPGGLTLPVVPPLRSLWQVGTTGFPRPLSMPALIFKAFWPKDSWRFCLAGSRNLGS